MRVTGEIQSKECSNI